MAAGDILKEALLVVDTFPVKTATSIAKGELVADDGAGLVPATAALAVAGKVMMALEASVAADPAYIECVVVGFVEAKKVSGSGAALKGDKLMISATPGQVTKFVKGDAPAGGASTYYTTTIETGVQAALDANAGVVGTATAVSVNGDTTQKMLIGVS
jgi:hypothetical protein